MSYERIHESMRKARKAHVCIWCGERISIGETHIYEFSKFDGDTQTHRWHPECDDAATDYFNSNEGPEFEAFANERPAYREKKA